MIGSYVRSSVFITIPAGADGGVFATCDPGDVVAGGGFSTNGEPGALRVYEARPQDPEEAIVEDGSGSSSIGTQYRVRAVNDTDTGADLQAWVICLDIAG